MKPRVQRHGDFEHFRKHETPSPQHRSTSETHRHRRHGNGLIIGINGSDALATDPALNSAYSKIRVANHHHSLFRLCISPTSKEWTINDVGVVPQPRFPVPRCTWPSGNRATSYLLIRLIGSYFYKTPAIWTLPNRQNLDIDRL